MPLPTVTVGGDVNDPSGAGINSTVYFFTTAEMVAADGTVLVPNDTPTKAKVVNGQIFAADGTSPLTLYSSATGSNTVPYLIRESWHGGREFTVTLTADLEVAGVIPYATLGPVSPAPTPDSPYATEPWVETYVADHAPATVAGVAPISGDVPVAGLVTALETGGLASATSVTNAQNTAETYTDTKITAEVTRADAAYDPAGTAAAAVAAALINTALTGTPTLNGIPFGGVLDGGAAVLSGSPIIVDCGASA